MQEKAHIILIIILSIMLFLTALDSLMKTALTGKGNDLSQVMKEVNEIKRQNALLKERLLNDESYRSIQEKAKMQGFVENRNQYVTFN